MNWNSEKGCFDKTWNVMYIYNQCLYYMESSYITCIFKKSYDKEYICTYAYTNIIIYKSSRYNYMINKYMY